MTRLPAPPTEVAACRDVKQLAPKFAEALGRVCMRLVEKGWIPTVLETARSEARAAFLYGFGRTYDDGRGIVTNVDTAKHGWHFYRLAADLGDRRYDADHTPAQFYVDLEAAAIAEGLTSGADWNRDGIHNERFCDRPHVQWYCDGMHVSPTDHAAELLEHGGYLAVWQALHAA